MRARDAADGERDIRGGRCADRCDVVRTLAARFSRSPELGHDGGSAYSWSTSTQPFAEAANETSPAQLARRPGTLPPSLGARHDSRTAVDGETRQLTST